MKFKTLGSTIEIYDDYIKEHPDRCKKIKRDLIRIKKDYEAPKINLNWLMSRFPLCTKAVERIRTGSHKEWHEMSTGYNAGRGWHDIIDDYKTIFNDCLPGRDWVEAHYQDAYPEPSMKLLIDGKAHNFNGNYKQGVIKQLIKSKRKEGN